jgi:hypothetical protein
MDRLACGSVLNTLARMVENLAYYFEMMFGDKDMYRLAAHVNSVPICQMGSPDMLGYVEGTEFVCQSMRQPCADGSTSHIHMTLLPYREDEPGSTQLPTHVCKDGANIKFVYRADANGKRTQTIGSTVDKVDALGADSLIPGAILRGSFYAKEYMQCMRQVRV